MAGQAETEDRERGRGRGGVENGRPASESHKEEVAKRPAGSEGEVRGIETHEVDLRWGEGEGMVRE